MSTPYARFGPAKTWMGFLVLLLMAVGVAFMIFGLYLAWSEKSLPVVVSLGYAITGVVIVAQAGLIRILFSLLFKMEGDAYRVHEVLMDTKANQDKQIELLSVMHDNSQISDAAKSITHRNLEREALRKAIREDILKEDWESAYSLIDEMERRFGYRLEAYHYRKEVDEFRATVIEDKLENGFRNVRRWIAERNWDLAQAETERLTKLAPEDERITEVGSEFRTKKNEYKESLLQQWYQAAENKDLDRAIELLKEINPYLARDEAEKLESSAREVFKAKLLDLGVQFRSAVTEKHWADAIAIGKQIRDEYPNSLMAKEVGDSMEALQAKAAASSAQPASG